MGWLQPLRRSGIPERFAVGRESDPMMDREHALGTWLSASLAAHPALTWQLGMNVVPQHRTNLLGFHHDMLSRIMGNVVNKTQSPFLHSGLSHILQQYLDRRETGGWHPMHQAYLPHTPTGRQMDIEGLVRHLHGLSEEGEQGYPLTLNDLAHPMHLTLPESARQEIGHALTHSMHSPSDFLRRMALLQSVGIGHYGMPRGIHEHLANVIRGNMQGRNEAASFHTDRLKDFGWHPEEVEPSEQHFGH